jgi:hypothetical protein
VAWLDALNIEVTDRQLDGLFHEQPATAKKPSDLHPATADLVRRFSVALAEKLAAAEVKYGYSDGWLSPDWMDECRAKLLEHVGKGDPRDVAAYCAFLWHHGESTAASVPSTAASVYLVATGETHDGQETYTRHEGSPPPLCDSERLYTDQPSTAAVERAKALTRKQQLELVDILLTPPPTREEIDAEVITDEEMAPLIASLHARMAELRASQASTGTAAVERVPSNALEAFATTMRTIYGNEFPEHPNSAGEYPGWADQWALFHAGVAFAAQPKAAPAQQGDAPSSLSGKPVRRWYRGSDGMVLKEYGDWVLYREHAAALSRAATPAPAAATQQAERPAPAGQAWVPVAIRRRTLLLPNGGKAHYLGAGTEWNPSDPWTYRAYSVERENDWRKDAELFTGTAAMGVQTEVEVLYAHSASAPQAEKGGEAS